MEEDLGLDSVGEPARNCGRENGDTKTAGGADHPKLTISTV